MVDISILYKIAKSGIILTGSSGPDRETGKFAGVIANGPDPNSNILFATKPQYDTPEEAKKEMIKFIDSAKKWAAEERNGINLLPESFLF